MLFDEITKYVDYYDKNDSDTSDKSLEAYLNLVFPDNSILLYNQLGLVCEVDTRDTDTDKHSCKTIKIPTIYNNTHTLCNILGFHVITNTGEIIIEELASSIGIILNSNLEIEKTILTLAKYKSSECSDTIDAIFDDIVDDAIVIYDNLTGEIISNSIAGLDKYTKAQIKVINNFCSYMLMINNETYIRKNISSYPIYIYNKVDYKEK